MRLASHAIARKLGRFLYLLCEPVEIAAGAKGAALAGQDDDIARRIALQIGEERRQLLVHRSVDAIDGMIAVERRRQHRAVALEGEARIADALDIEIRGHQLSPILTSLRPKFSPLKRPQKAPGSASNPSKISSL